MTTSFTREALEDAVRAALAAPAISGSKWRPLEQLYARDGIRVSGAIVTTAGNRRSRVRQILARRRHAGFGTYGLPGFGILVLAGSEAELDATDPAYLDQYVQSALLAEVSSTSEPLKLTGALILRHNAAGELLIPRRLVVLSESEVGEELRRWYADIGVTRAPEGRKSGSLPIGSAPTRPSYRLC